MTKSELGNKGEVRPSVNEDGRLKDKIDDEKDEDLAAVIKESDTDTVRCPDKSANLPERNEP